MEYIVISLLAIVGATLVVYKLSNSILGIALRLRPLLLCAVCAMIISLVLPKIVVSFAGLSGTLVVVALFAIVFAYFVARLEDMPVDETGETMAGTENSCGVNGHIEPEKLEHKENYDNKLFVGEIYCQPTEEIVQVRNESTDEGVSISEGYEEYTEQILEEALTKQVVAMGAEEEYGQKEISVQLLAEKIEEELDVPDQVETVLNVEDQLTKNNSGDPDIDMSPVTYLQIPTDDLIEEQLVVEQRPEESEKDFQISDPTIIVAQEADNGIMAQTKQLSDSDMPASELLDDLLEFAFIHKEQHNYDLALNAFRRALSLYSDSDAAPLLVVEIGNLLKNKGAYDEAIIIFTDGRNLTKTKQDDMLEQEFVNTIAYLRIIKNVLVHHRLGAKPFAEIPPQILTEIDNEFREWRNLGNI